MINIYFFHAVIEVWNGATLRGKHSDTHVMKINKGDSVAKDLDEWVFIFQQRLMESYGKEAISWLFVVTSASFIQDPASFESIPEEWGL